MAKSRPFGVTILAILYWIVAAIWTLAFFSWDNVVNEYRDLGWINQSQADNLIDFGWIVLVIALFYFLVGFGLWKLWNIARIVAVILAVFTLLAFPIGTIFGIIVIWYL
ncbi:MAG: hypothetical protein ACFFDT_40865, partial [Candidatus Hodarchaeota archaeon]